MTRVDFYILPDADEDRRQVYMCRLADKAWRMGHRIWIHVPAAARAEMLDERLWTFSQGSFLPHERAEDGAIDSECPVILGAGEPDGERQLLINDAVEVPPFFSRFERVAEVINQDPESKTGGRARYAFYRDRGYELHYHNVS